MAEVRLAGESKITLIPAGCPAMFCDPDLAHRCFRWCLEVTGRIPAQLPAAAHG